MPPLGVLGLDGFGRTASGAWEAADAGGAYTLLGPAGDFGVASGAGMMRIPAPGALRAASLLTLKARDVDVRVRLETDQAANGGDEFAFLILRLVDADTYYLARVRFDPSHAAWLQAGRSVHGTTELLGTEAKVPGYTHGSGQLLWVRAAAVDSPPASSLRLKAWAEDQAEPADWQYVAADAEPMLASPGSVALQGYLSQRATNAPVTFRFSGFRVADAVGPEFAFAEPRPVAAAPPPPTAEDAWDTLQPQLAGVWGSDTPATVDLLDGFLARFPEYAPAREKLYAALLSRGHELVSDGQTDAAVTQLTRAQEVLPQRGEAPVALSALTPTPVTRPASVVAPAPPPAPAARVSAPTPVPPARPAAPAPRPAAPAPPPPAAVQNVVPVSPPTPTKAPFSPPPRS